MLSRPEIEMTIKEAGFTNPKFIEYGTKFAEQCLKNGIGIQDVISDLRALEKGIKLDQYKKEHGSRFDDGDLNLSDGKVRGMGQEFDPDRFLKSESVTASKQKLENVSESFANGRKKS